MVVDVLIVVLVLAFAALGWAEGLVRALWAYTGLMLGAALGILVAPPLLERLDLTPWLALFALTTVAVCAGIGRWSMVRAQDRFRLRVPNWLPRRIDRLAGAAFGAVATFGVTWMLGFALAGSTLPGVAGEANRSEVLRVVDGMHLPVSSFLLDRFVVLGDDADFPRLVDVFTAERIVAVAAPSEDVVEDPDVLRASRSTWKIRTVDTYPFGSEGTGFLVAPDRLMTAAHVVAEAEEITVVTDEQDLAAEVLYCDVVHDVAVVDVPGLAGRELTFTTAEAGAPVAVVGYPQDGPLDVGAARVRERREWQTSDVYGDGRYVHEGYVVRGVVRGGNSGGPLVAPDGRVLGVVVASSRADRETGYVLGGESVIDALAAATDPGSRPTGCPSR